MEFIKRNWFVLGCFGVVLVSVGLGLMACNRFTTIDESMKQAVEFGQRLGNAGKAEGRKDTLAEPDLDMQAQNIKTVQDELKKVSEGILDRNRGPGGKLEYLLDEAFPDPKNNRTVYYTFANKYRDAIKNLPERMQAKGLPTAEDEARVKEAIDEENRERGISESTPRKPAAGTAVPAAGNRGGLPIEALRQASERRNTATPPRSPAEPNQAIAGEDTITPEERVRTDPKQRAQIERAMSIRCYVGNSPSETFTIIPEALDVKTIPTPADLWRAQMTLWVQREICDAINGVNEDAEKALKKADPNAQVNVTTLPIKRLVKLVVPDYCYPQGLGGGAPGGPGGARPAERPERADRGGGLGAFGGGLAVPAGSSRTPPRTGEPAKETETPAFQMDLSTSTWTGRQPSPELDIVRLGIVLDMDLRALEQLIDRICRANFYVPTSVNYRIIDRSRLDGPYVYGPVPVVQVQVTFERYFFPKIYTDKMPVMVHERLGHPLQDQPGAAGRGGPRRPN